MLCVHPQRKREAAASLFLECFFGTQIHVCVTPGRAFRMRQIPSPKKRKKKKEIKLSALKNLNIFVSN